MSSLPPLISSGVFYASASCDIDAPANTVWKNLLDFPSYPGWNPFVRSQVVTDSSGNPLEDQTARTNTYITLKTNMPATLEPTRSSQSTTRCLITILDHESFRAAWVYTLLPSWLLWTERWQTLTILDNGRTRYETREVFGGILAYIVKFLYQGTLNECFAAMGKALKEVSEQQST